VSASRLAGWLRLSWRDRLLVADATGTLLVASVALHALPFRWVSPCFGVRGQESTSNALPGSTATVHRIVWAIATAARAAPWRCKCLEQALAARWLLKKRRIPSTLYIGVGPAGPASLEAHAWLRSGSVIVCGDALHERFAPLVAYGDAQA
jgi:hypothetical protein